MYRIIKNTNDGNLIIDENLTQAWSHQENRYEGNLYYGILSRDERTRLINLMLHEQNSLCCYCMKQIESSDVTIEHIIPQHAGTVEFNTYLTVEEFNQTIHKDNFDRYSNIIPPDGYPHDLSYNNLIASCDSKTHCNNKRGSQFVSLLVYDDIMISNLTYEPFGSITVTEDISIKPLNLDNDFLKMVRRVWFEIAKRFPEIQSFESLHNLTQLLDEVLPYLEDKYIDTFYNSPKVVDLFKYRWFYGYFLEQENYDVA